MPLAGQPEENLRVVIARAQVSIHDVVRSVQKGKKPNGFNLNICSRSSEPL